MVKVKSGSRFHLFQSFQSPGDGDAFRYTFGVEIENEKVVELIYIDPPPPGLFPGISIADSPYLVNAQIINSILTFQALLPGESRINLWMYINGLPMRDGTLLNSYEIVVEGNQNAFQTNVIGRWLVIVLFILIFVAISIFCVKNYGNGNRMMIPLSEEESKI